MKFKSKKLTALAMAVLMAASTMSSAVFAEDVGVPAAVEAVDTEVVVSDAEPTVGEESDAGVPATIEAPEEVSGIGTPVVAVENEGGGGHVQNVTYIEGSVTFTADANGKVTSVTYQLQQYDDTTHQPTTTITVPLEEKDYTIIEDRAQTCENPQLLHVRAYIKELGQNGDYRVSDSLPGKPALGHKFIEDHRDTITDETCTQEGEVHVVYKCANAGHCEAGYDRKGGMTDEEVDKEVAADPTLAATLQKHKTLPAKGHDFSGDAKLYPKSGDGTDAAYKEANIKTATAKNTGVKYEGTNADAQNDKYLDFTNKKYGHGGKADTALEGLPLVDANRDGHYEYRKYCSRCDVYEIVSEDDIHAQEGYIAVVTKSNSDPDCNIAFGSNIGTKDVINEQIRENEEFKWNTGFKPSDKGNEFELSDEYALKIELSNCSKDGWFEVTYYNKDGVWATWESGDRVPAGARKLATIKYDIEAHHMAEKEVAEFLTEKDEEQCDVSYVDGKLVVTNKSCKSGVTYYRVTHCTAKGCPDNGGKGCWVDLNGDGKLTANEVLCDHPHPAHVSADCRSIDGVTGEHNCASIVEDYVEPNTNHKVNSAVKWVVDQINAGKTLNYIVTHFADLFPDVTPAAVDNTPAVAAIAETLPENAEAKKALEEARLQAENDRAAHDAFDAKIAFLNRVIASDDTQITFAADPDCAKGVYSPKATCTEKGTIIIKYTCIVCGKPDIAEDQIVEPILGHEIDPNDAVIVSIDPEANCEHKGKMTTIVECSRCHEEFYRREIEIPRTAHTNEKFADGYKAPGTEVTRPKNPTKPDPDENNSNGEEVKLRWDKTANIIIDGNGADGKNDTIWKRYEEAQKQGKALELTWDNDGYDQLYTDDDDSCAIYVGEDIAGFRAILNAFTLCRFCEKYDVNLLNSYYRDGVKVTVESLKKETTNCEPGSITLLAEYKGTTSSGKEYTAQARKIFTYYSSRTAYNGKVGHDWGPEKVLERVEPTLEAEGKIVYGRECTVCHHVEETRTEVLPKLEPVVPVEKPATVTGLKVEAVGAGRVNVSWNPVDDADYYVVLLHDSFEYKGVAKSVSAPKCNTSITGLDTEVFSHIWVAAVKRGVNGGKDVVGDAGQYQSILAREVPTVTGLKASAEAGKITLTWKAQSRANTYSVAWKSTADDTVHQVVVGDETTYTLENTTKNVGYYFWVYAGYTNSRTNKNGEPIGETTSAGRAFAGIVAK